MSRLKEFDILPDTEAGVWYEDVCIGRVAAIDSDSLSQRWAFWLFQKDCKWNAYHGARKVKMRCKRDAVAALMLSHLADSIELDSGEDGLEHV